MIICKDCGYQNEEGDAFCGSCGSFLEWTGAKVEEAERGYAYDVSDAPADEGTIGKVKRALSVDDDSIAAHESTQERVAADDAAMAAAIVAQREAEEEAVRQAAAEAEAKRMMEAAEAERASAERAAQEAQERAEAARRDAEQRAEEAERRAEEERVRREEQAAKAVAEAEERARREAEERRAREEADAAAAQERLAAEQAAADAAAVAARQAEEAAERERVAAEEKVREAAANAAAAALRAMEEQDARAAAEAAKAQAEAEAVQARAEAEAAKAAAAEETARAKAELEQARAEAARLKAEAEARDVQQRLDAQRARAEAEAREEQEAARRRAEAEAEAKRRIEEAEAEAAARREREEAEAATRAAEAEAARLRSEAEAAAAKAAAEKARQEAEAIEARRAREAALEKAAALVAKPVAEKPADPAPASKPGKAADKPDKAAGKDQAAAAVAGVDGTPAGQKPGQSKARPAPVTKSAPSKEINHGDLVCGHCGEGNPPSRKFCRRCGESLTEAVAVKLSWWKKILRALRPKPKQYEAGQRKGRGGQRGTGVRDARSKSQVLFFRLNTWLFRIGAILGVAAVLGFGVEPIRQKLHLPNVREQAINKIKNVLTPKFDPVRPVGATGAAEKDHAAGLAIDLVSNSFWSPPPSGDGGVGGTLRVRFERPFDLARMLVTSGTAGTDAENGFVSRPRINELELIVNGDVATSKRITLKDIDKPQTIKQTLKGITTLDMKVVSVYPAATPTKSSAAISEIEFFEKRKFGDNYETLKPSKVTVSAGDAKALADSDLSTSWIADESKPGVGQSFTITFAEPSDVDRIRIAPGRAGDDFRRTPRPKDLQFVFTCDPACEPTGQSSVEDAEGLHSVGQSRKKVRSIQVQIRTVNGDEGAGGVAIAEVEVQRKRPS